MAKLIAILFALLFSSKVMSFTLSVSNGAYFEKDEVVVNVADNCARQGLTSDGILSLAVEAVEQYWNKVPTSRLKLKAGAVVSVGSAFYDDEICSSINPCVPNDDLKYTSGILISCNENQTATIGNIISNSIIALTVPNSVAGQNIISATLLINDRAGNQFATKSRAEQISILAHEIGHAIGLGHSPVKDSLMYYQSIATRFRLGWDDIDGVTYLYPVEQPLSGCGTVDMSNSPPNQAGPLLLGFLFAVMTGYVFRKKIFRV